MAYTRIILSHRGSVNSDSLEDKAFMAFNISITTKLTFTVSIKEDTEQMIGDLHGE